MGMRTTPTSPESLFFTGRTSKLRICQTIMYLTLKFLDCSDTERSLEPVLVRGLSWYYAELPISGSWVKFLPLPWGSHGTAVSIIVHLITVLVSCLFGTCLCKEDTKLPHPFMLVKFTALGL